VSNMMKFKIENHYELHKNSFWLWNLNYQNELLKNKLIDTPIKTQLYEVSFGIGGLF
jgi:hypothetical protein